MDDEKERPTGRLEAYIQELLHTEEVESVTISVHAKKRGGPDARENQEQSKKIADDADEELTQTRKERDDAKTELTQTRKERDDAKTELTQTRKERDDAKTELTQTRKERDEANETLTRTKNQLTEANAELTQTRKERDDANETLTQTKARLSEAETKVEPFTRLLSVFDAYRALPEEWSADAKKVVSGTNPVKFLAAAGDWNRILRYWDEARRGCERADDATRQTFTDTLRFLLDCYNGILSSPVYALMPPENDVGKPYDRNRQQQSAQCSHTQGNVETVLLPGIRKLTGEIVKKSVVYWQGY